MSDSKHRQGVSPERVSGTCSSESRWSYTRPGAPAKGQTAQRDEIQLQVKL